MSNFKVYFEGGRDALGNGIHTFYGYTKDSVIRKAKERANMYGCNHLDISYLESKKMVGVWRKHNGRWYKEF